MFWKITEFLKGERVEKNECPYSGTIETLVEQVNTINSTCCSSSHIEERVKTNMLLEQLATKIDGLAEKLKDTEITLNKYRSYTYIAIGIFLAIQFLGMGDKLKKILLG